jgi:hypothetical protein
VQHAKLRQVRCAEGMHAISARSAE